MPKTTFVPVIKIHNERCDQKINSGLTDKQNYLIHFTCTDNVYKCLSEVNFEGFKLIPVRLIIIKNLILEFLFGIFFRASIKLYL